MENFGKSSPKRELGSACWNVFSNGFADSYWSDLDLIGFTIIMAVNFYQKHMWGRYTPFLTGFSCVLWTKCLLLCAQLPSLKGLNMLPEVALVSDHPLVTMVPSEIPTKHRIWAHPQQIPVYFRNDAGWDEICIVSRANFSFAQWGKFDPKSEVWWGLCLQSQVSRRHWDCQWERISLGKAIIARWFFTGCSLCVIAVYRVSVHEASVLCLKYSIQ